MEMLIRKCQWMFKRIKVGNVHAACPPESDSDTKIPTRRSRYYPVPNIEIARQRDKSTAKKNQRLPNSVHNAGFSLRVFRSDGNFCKLKCKGP